MFCGVRGCRVNRWRLVPRLVVGLGAGLFAGVVGWACAGGGYDTSWDPQDSNAILSPANDTRANLILLMADRQGTRVADPGRMAKGIVPFDFPYLVMVDRLTPEEDPGAAYALYQKQQEQYGLSSETSPYSYSGDNLGLCHSNRAGAAAFNAAVTADPALAASEKASLLAARTLLAKACDKAGEMTFDLPARTPAAQAYGKYLEGARLFYAERLTEASTRFAAVGRPGSGWLAETAAYMQFRTALAKASRGTIGNWGELLEAGKRDLPAIAAAEASRLGYLRDYPDGRYSRSARDLSRRIAWLSGDRSALGTAYSTLVASKAPTGLPNLEAIAEVDRKLLPSSDGAGITDPALLAVVDLMRLRPTPEYDQERACCGTELSRAELERQRPLFRGQPDLFTYLLAVEAFHHRHRPAEVLALIPDAAGQARFSYVQFSRQMLRGFALEAVGDRNARAFWISLFRGAVQPYQREAVELALLAHDRRAGVVGRLLETGSPVLHPLIRQAIIEKDAGPGLLRSQAQSGSTQQQRDVALYLLLANELHHGLYREFLSDQALVKARPAQSSPDAYRWAMWSVNSYEPQYSTELTLPPLDIFAVGGSNDLRACPEIKVTAASLAADPSAIRPRLCLAEFIRRKGLDGWNDDWTATGDAKVLSARNHFTGTPITRSVIYAGVLASPMASDDDKAFALNRSVRCYQPAGGNSCGGNDVPLATRKGWFDRLKREFPETAWAKELKYYW